MNFLVKLDDFIVDKIFQPIVEKFVDNIGSTATSCMIGSVVFNFVSISFRIFQGNIDSFTMVMNGLSMVFGFLLISLVASLGKTIKPGIANPLRITHFNLRNIILLMTILFFDLGHDLPSMIYDINSILNICAFYFLACQPRTPFMRKKTVPSDSNLISIKGK